MAMITDSVLEGLQRHRFIFDIRFMRTALTQAAPYTNLFL